MPLLGELLSQTICSFCSFRYLDTQAVGDGLPCVDVKIVGEARGYRRDGLRSPPTGTFPV